MDKVQQITTDDINKTLSAGKKKNFFIRYWWQLLIVAIVAGAVSFYFLSKDKQQIENYKTVKLEKKDLVITVLATGNLEPINTVDIGIEVSGTLKEVLVDYSQSVKKGQVLAKLDTTKLLSKVNNSKASLKVAQANLEDSKISLDDAQHELDRLEKLYKSTNGNYPSVKEIDQLRVTYRRAKENYNSMQARVDQSQATLKSDEDDLKKAVVISPIDGIVLDKKVEVGQSVVASMQVPILFTIAKDLTQMQVVVSIDEADVGKVKESQDVTFTVDAYPTQVFKGKLKQVRMNSQIVNGVVTYDALAVVDNSQLLLRPGMTVSAKIVTKVIEDSVVLPNSAFRFSPNMKNKKASRKYIFSARTKKDSKNGHQATYIWILKDNQAVQIPVRTKETDGVYTIVKSKQLDENSEIIIGTK